MNALEIIALCLLLFISFFVAFLLIIFSLSLLARTCNKLADTKTAYLALLFVLLILSPIIYFILFNYGLQLWMRVVATYLIVCFFGYYLTPILYKLYKAKVSATPSIKAGAREAKYRLHFWGAICFVIAGILLVIGVWLLYEGIKSDARSFALKMVIPFIVTGVIFRRITGIYKKQLKEIAEIKHTSFVLFLREFKYEKAPFYFGKYLSEFGKTNVGIGASYSTMNIAAVNFETFFSQQIKIHIGELVGLGNPEDVLPHESIKMIYTLDDWRKQFFSLAQSATCIVVQPCLTESLRYELTELFQSGLAKKLYFFTKPRCKNLYRRCFTWVIDFGLNRKPFEWPSFQKMLHQIGFAAGITVQKGAVVGFKQDNEAVLLKENCELPSDYIKAVKADLLGKGILQ